MSSGGITAHPLVGVPPSSTAAVPPAASPNPLLAAPVATAATVAPIAAAPIASPAPGAWDDAWAKKFTDAGAPPDIVSQMMLTGANGADAAALQQMLDQLVVEVDAQIAQFAQSHPEDFAILRENPEVDRAKLVQVAMAANAGELEGMALADEVDHAGKSGGRKMWDQMGKPTALWMAVPGYGALRVLGSVVNGGTRDPFTNERLWEGKFLTAVSLLGLGGGSVTLNNYLQNARQAAAGQRLLTEGSPAAAAIAAQGVDVEGARAQLPGSKANRLLSGASRMDDQLRSALERMPADSLERELAEEVVKQWERGETAILGDKLRKHSKIGPQPNVRGMTFGRTKPMVSTGMFGSNPAVLLDRRMQGPTLPAFLASTGVDLVDDTPENGNLRSRMLAAYGHGDGVLDDAARKLLRERALGTAAQQLLDANVITRPQGLQSVHEILRPGAITDAVWAADNVGAGALGKLHGWAAIPKSVKIGGALAAVAGLGYQFMVKPMLNPPVPEGQAAPADGSAPAPTGTAPAGTAPVAGPGTGSLPTLAAAPAPATS